MPQVASATLARAAVAAEADDRADRGDGVVAVAAGELVEGVPAPSGRTGKCASTISSPGSRDVVMWNWKKSSAGIVAPAVRPLGDDAAAGQHEHHRHLGGGIGMAEAADDGAAVADRDVRDMRHRLADERVGLVRGVAQLELAMPGHRLDDDLAVLDRDAGEAGDVLDVDEAGRAGETEVHRRDEALPAGEHHRSGIGGEKRDRLADRLRRTVFEERRLHPSSDPAP